MKTGNVILTTVIAAVVGYGAGAVLGIPGVEGGRLAGDISGTCATCTMYGEVSEKAQIFEERITNDSTFRKETQSQLEFMVARAEGLLAASKLSREAISNISELKSYEEVLTSIEDLASNTLRNGQEALEKLDLIANGSSDGSYEEAANKAVMGMLLSEKCTELERQFIAAVDSFLKDKKVENYEQLAFARDQWLAYDVTTCAINADVSAIQDKNFILSNQKLAMLSKKYKEKSISQSNFDLISIVGGKRPQDKDVTLTFVKKSVVPSNASDCLKNIKKQVSFNKNSMLQQQRALALF